MNNNGMTFMEYVIILVIVFGIVFGLRLGWAKLVYNDLRCAIADCRIIK